jgi:hypothetical protein
MTFFSSGVIGFAAEDATVAEAIPNPFFFHRSCARSRVATSEEHAIKTGLLWRRPCAGSN